MAPVRSPAEDIDDVLVVLVDRHRCPLMIQIVHASAEQL